MTERYIAFENELGKCKHSFELPHEFMQRVRDVPANKTLRHPVERFRPGMRRTPADVIQWCLEHHITVLHVYGDIFTEWELENYANARAVKFPRPWLAIRFAALQDVMLFKLSWPE